MSYASADDLAAYLLGSAYTAPAGDEAAYLLREASALIDFATQNRSAADNADADVLKRATCQQVEYWLETGPEHDVLGLKGSLQGGRVQVQKLPPILGQRTLRTLLAAGMYYAGARTV